MKYDECYYLDSRRLSVKFTAADFAAVRAKVKSTVSRLLVDQWKTLTKKCKSDQNTYF